MCLTWSRSLTLQSWAVISHGQLGAFQTQTLATPTGHATVPIYIMYRSGLCIGIATLKAMRINLPVC